MGPLIYSLCALAAATCAYMLLQSYRRGGYRLLLWSGLCFAGLTASNVILVLDRIVYPGIDFSTLRLSAALVGLLLLLFGLIWENE